jgi:hypothetical protein
MAWKSGLKVILLPFGPSCPLQTILLSDLVGCDTALQIIMVFGALFSNLKQVKQPLLSAAGGHTPPSMFKFKEKCAKLPSPSSAGRHTQLDGQHCPLRTYHNVFFFKGSIYF